MQDLSILFFLFLQYIMPERTGKVFRFKKKNKQKQRKEGRRE